MFHQGYNWVIFLQGQFKCGLGSIGALRKQISTYLVSNSRLCIGNLNEVLIQLFVYVVYAKNYTIVM